VDKEKSRLTKRLSMPEGQQMDKALSWDGQMSPCRQPCSAGNKQHDQDAISTKEQLPLQIAALDSHFHSKIHARSKHLAWSATTVAGREPEPSSLHCRSCRAQSGIAGDVLMTERRISTQAR
jgi:hypothetical protein